MTGKLERLAERDRTVTHFGDPCIHCGTAHGADRTTFQWTGKSWSSPGTGWGTKPSMMAVLGWAYVSPVAANRAPSETGETR